MPTTVILSIGSRTSDSVTVNTVTTTTVAGYANAWNVVLSATVPSTTKIGDKLTTGANDYLIVNISGSTLTVAGDPFTVTATPSAGSGSTLRAFPSVGPFAAGAPASLVAKDWIWQGELYKEGPGPNGEWNSASTGQFYATTDATRYHVLRAASGQSFYDNANRLSNALRYNPANGVAASNGVDTVNGNNTLVYFDKLQLKVGTLKNFGGGTFNFSNCIFEATLIHQGVNVYNSLFVYKTATSAIDDYFASSPQNASFINNTFVCLAAGNTNYAFPLTSNYASGNIFRNCAVYGFGGLVKSTEIGKINAAQSTYNVSDNTFLWTATGNIGSTTFANQFQNITSGSEDLRVKFGANLINAGIRDQTYTNDLDIVGSARSIAAPPNGPTVGAWEFTTTIYTFARPSSDVTTQWTPSTAGPHYVLINETTPNDANYIAATAAARTDEVGLQAMSTPLAGSSVFINYRVQGIVGGGSVTVSLYSGATLVKTDTTRTANNTSPAYYTMTVTAAEWGAVAVNWSNMRLRFVSA